MKYYLFIVLFILLSALIVLAAVPVNVTWGTTPSSTSAVISVPWPGFEDEPSSVPIPINSKTPLLKPLASISKSLVDDLS